jgi:UrcA family protein
MRNLIAPAALFASLVLGSTAFAQTTSNSPTTAPVVQERPLDRTTMIGAPIDQITASEPVSYADLNLSNPADVKTLDRRVDAAAVQSCRAINQEYPSEFYPPVGGVNCINSTEHRAQQEVKALTSR